MTFHIEPYGGRTASSVGEDIRYIYHRYGRHPGTYKQESRNGAMAPVYFLFVVSSQHMQDEADSWREVVAEMRGSEMDGVFLSLFVDERDYQFIDDVGFDGAYSYLGSAGMTKGSTTGNWKRIRECLRDKLFYPSISPGYNDTNIRPWNSHTTNSRQSGNYYDKMWS